MRSRRKEKRANAFTVLEDSAGQAVYREEEIAKVVVKYFQDLYTFVEGNREATVSHALNRIISDEENAELIREPTDQEIKDEVLSIHEGKAPGPDGFSASFFHSNWETVGPEIATEIKGFFESGQLPSKINETHVRLIPKMLSARTVAEYRPISLSNVYYKIISKMLTRRMQPLLEKIISEKQSAFVPGRAISDNVLITHEVLHFLKTSKAQKRCPWRSKHI